MIIDFHTHTYHSYDSLMKPEKILSIAKSRGLDGIVICDHNTIKGGVEASKINSDPDFKVIVGAEIATDAGDITGIFLTREIVSRKFDEVAKEIKAQGGKIILNHPYKAHNLSLIDFNLIDYIEGYNSRVSKKDNEKAVALAKKYNKPIVAGSDSHLYGEIAKCKTEVNNPDELLPLNSHCQKSRYYYITLSQYIKAYKRKSVKIFVSASALFIKNALKNHNR